eukprot:TRINITY_DN7097_c0_g3_i4.p1 TRINITY_DN7097_c0_g3~~TRINITY_DN7097_c0_g3_i4.p1  ORF type:complete len:293 (+),score=32.78 TRINITY_DN7097_c0_g3_i4:114-992(+)
MCKKHKMRIQELNLLNEQLISNQKGHEKQLKKYMLENKRLKLLVSTLENNTEDNTKLKQHEASIKKSKPNVSVDLPRKSNAHPKHKTIEFYKPSLALPIVKEFLEPLKQAKYTKEQVLFHCENHINNLTEYYEYITNKLRRQLKAEKSVMFKLKLEKAICPKKKFEELFLDCVEETCGKYLKDGAGLEVSELRKTMSAEEKVDIMTSFIGSEKFLELLHAIKLDMINFIELPSLIDRKKIKRNKHEDTSKKNTSFVTYSSNRLEDINDSKQFARHNMLHSKLTKRLKLLNFK